MYYAIGLGVEAEVGAQRVLVGSDRLMAQHAIAIPDDLAAEGVGGSRIFVAADGVLLAAIHYSDPVRSESAEIVRRLRAMGIEIHLLTGDREETAMAVGDALGIERRDVHARLFPEDKAAFVRALRDRGRRVAFAGDGVNDLPALAYADVAISFASASDAARERPTSSSSAAD